MTALEMIRWALSEGGKTIIETLGRRPAAAPEQEQESMGPAARPMPRSRPMRYLPRLAGLSRRFFSKLQRH